MTSLPVFEGWSESMAVAEFENGSWGNISVISQSRQQIHPAAMAMQFGASVFEGFKAFRSATQNANTFRVADNYARMASSCARLCIPSPSYEMYIEAMRLIVSQAASWSRPFKSEWLYVRPIIIALDAHIMPIVSSSYAFYLLTAPIRAFDKPTFNLRIEDQYSRAAPGGLGAAKTGANYAHQLLPTENAKKQNYDGVLWLDSATHSTIEEASTMNIFFRVGDEVHTPVLTDTILPGITRYSVLSLLRKNGWAVSERAIGIEEIVGWVRENALNEAFVSSTALGVREVNNISYRDTVYASSRDASLSGKLRQSLLDIYRGESSEFKEWVSPVCMQEAEYAYSA